MRDTTELRAVTAALLVTLTLIVASAFLIARPAPRDTKPTPGTIVPDAGPRYETAGSSLEGFNSGVLAVLHAIAVERDKAEAHRRATEPPPPTEIPEPSPPVEVAPPPGDTGCPYADLIRSIWTTDAEWAIDIAMRESHCQPDARNPSGASGLFQMMLPLHSGIFESVGCSPDQWADPSCNVRAAWALYQGSGRTPWAL